ncbi:hypothetical protein ACWOAH_08450 [Vagococcus vulneris]|uniref:DUF5067 domain-containing protein n=1 Tax=Vagococcus vulneris TaxID=1977869 RepID=A0A429ZX92_9ENTE|nr:hypothetical protein [Vagococcus vulneris]RST98449.1 hypothetical protein CBF37_08015 [Vagococcus vulneris]
MNKKSIFSVIAALCLFLLAGCGANKSKYNGVESEDFNFEQYDSHIKLSDFREKPDVHKGEKATFVVNILTVVPSKRPGGDNRYLVETKEGTTETTSLLFICFENHLLCGWFRRAFSVV